MFGRNNRFIVVCYLKKGEIYMYSDIYVTLSVEESIKVLQEWVETKGNFIRKIGKNIIDKCTIDFGEGKKAVIVVIEYYTWRNSNQMTATVVIDNAEGNTKIHITVGGSSQGLIFSYDYGAGESLEENLKSHFQCYKIEMR